MIGGFHSMKKNIVFIIAVVVLISLFSGCQSGRSGFQPIEPVRQRIIGAEGVEQPDWVYQTPKSADLHYETGYAKLSNKANSIKRANAEAKEKISQWINTNVQSVVINYTSDFGEGDNRQALEAFESISRLTSETSLVGVTQEAVWVDQDGGVWVLCSMPIENTLKAFERAATSVAAQFETNEAAKYAESKMNEALEKLEQTLKNR